AAGAGPALGNLAGRPQPLLPCEVGAGSLASELAGHAAAEARRPGLAVSVDLDVKPRGQRVHDRGADAVQAAGGGVGAAAELAARVQPRHDELDAGELSLPLVVHRD